MCSASFYRLSSVNKDINLEVPSSSSSPKDDFIDEDNKPIKFSTSEANKHRAYDTFFHESNAPWYQALSVSISVAVFLVYFCMLREENDVDEQMGKSLWEKIPPLKEQTLAGKIREGIATGTDTSAAEKELEELHKKHK